MYTRWTEHLKTPEEKERFTNQVLASKPVLDRILELLNTVEAGMDRNDRDIKQFESPSWAYLQAYNNGYRAALGSLKTMIDIDQQRK